MYLIRIKRILISFKIIMQAQELSIAKHEYAFICDYIVSENLLSLVHNLVYY